MKEIKKNFKEIVCNPWYYVPVIIVCLFCFGYLMTHSTVNIDSLTYDKYFAGTVQFEHERFLTPILEKVLRIFDYNPFFMDFLGMLIFILAAITMCLIIKDMTKSKLKIYHYTIFSILFISYPLLPEYWTYNTTALVMPAGYILTFISSYSVYKASKKRFKEGYKTLLLQSINMFLAVSLYESFATVFLACLCIYILIDIIINNKKFKFKDIFLIFLKSAVVLLIGVISKVIIGKLIIIIFNLPYGAYVNRTIYYSTEGIWFFVSSVIKQYFIAAVYYFPITIFVITLIIGGFYSLYQGFTKDKMIILMYFGLILSVFSLSILTGGASPYRTCQALPIFVAIIFLLVGYSIKKETLKNIFVFSMFVLAFYQSKEIHKWFYANDLRYQEEKRMLITVGNDLMQNYDVSKPLVVLGSYELSPNIKEYIYLDTNSLKFKITRKLYGILNEELLLVRIGETNLNSYIAWGIYAFDENSLELNKLWKLLHI